jgi:hypothetical protein
MRLGASTFFVHPVEIQEDWSKAHHYLNMEMLRDNASSSNSWRLPERECDGYTFFPALTSSPFC